MQSQKQFQQLQQINYFSLETLESTYEDRQTVQAYISAIKNNQHLFFNKTVVHLTYGCNCLYSIIAAEAGAKKVYCVINGHDHKQQQNIFMMRQIIKCHAQSTNNPSLITTIQVKFYKDFNYRVDIVIGQPMGHCLYFDSLFDRMIQIKDLYLDPNGIILPNKINFKCCLVHDQHYIDKRYNFWDDLYGIKMTSMKQWIAQQPIIRVVDPTLIVSNIAKFMSYDIKNTKYQSLENFNSIFQLTLNDSQLNGQYKPNGLSIWFEVEFTHGHQKAEIKASPWNEPTRWAHMTLYASQNWNLKQVNKIKLSAYKNYQQNQGIINVNINSKQQIYYYS